MNTNKIALLVVIVMMVGCDAINPVLKESYTVTHVDGREIMVIHSGNTYEAIVDNCGVYYKKIKTTHGINASGYEHHYKVPSGCTASTGNTCEVWAATPVNSATQGIWNDEEERCQGI